MAIETFDPERGVTFVTLAESMQNDVDTLLLSGNEDEDLVNTYHLTACAYSQTDGEAECNCLPITVSTRAIARIGASAAASLIEPYLEQPLP